MAQQGDRIGWRFTDPVGLISFDYTETHKTYFSASRGEQEVYKTYEFDNIYLPAIFSIAVHIDPGK